MIFESRIAKAIELKTHAVALTWAEEAPEGALEFKPGRWGCVMSLIATVAKKGRVGAFSRETYGCWGGGVGLGFGNCYKTFPGGIEGFCGFLADGNEKSEEGRQIGEQLAGWGNARLTDDFLKGERYLKSAEVTKRFLDAMPMREILAKYVVVKPLDLLEEDDDVKTVTFFVTAEQLSALVILANYMEPELDNVTVPWAAACQTIGIFGYRELERERPRAVIGHTDISARLTTKGSLGRDVMSFTVPWPLYLKMDENVEGSFLQRKTWTELRES